MLLVLVSLRLTLNIQYNIQYIILVFLPWTFNMSLTVEISPINYIVFKVFNEGTEVWKFVRDAFRILSNIHDAAFREIS